MSCELGKKYDEKSQAIPYPDNIGPKPSRENFNSAREYGIALGEWEAKRDERNKGREAHRTAQYELELEFRAALAEELGLTGHPKFDKLYEIAYEDCHSEGFWSVGQRCDTLAELLRD